MTFCSQLLLLLCLASQAFAASTEWKTNPYGQVRLVASHERAPKQGEIFLGMHFKTIPGWHVYWKNSGDAGFAPQFAWNGSRGLAGTETLWPMPMVYALPGGLKAIGYEGEVVYPIRARVKTTGDTLHIAADVNYLTCGTSELCVPFHYSFALDIPVGDPAALDSQTQSLIEQFRARVPATEPAIEQLPKAKEMPAPVSMMLSLWVLILLGFLGGLILNVMPCVLPVLSIKLLWFFQQGEEHHPLAIRGGALAGAAGIITSFIGLALVAIAARHLGHAVGWGIQFQEPVFVAFLGVVIFLFALNLWGVFEIGLPRFLGQFATSASGEETWLTHFVSGLFVTLLATPCSAPFLGSAMGFALTQPANIVLIAFLAAGTGMAFPYLVLAALPNSIRWLPKPGSWMIYVRYSMGFLLLLTLAWLEYVLSRQIHTTGLVLFNGVLVGLGLLSWLKETVLVKHHGESTGTTRMLGALMGLLVLAALGLVRHARLSDLSRDVSAAPATETLAWIPFDEERIRQSVSQGYPVLVDVTADWCFTCKYNERFVLAQGEVVQALKQRHVVVMRADWTNRDARIGDYLKRFGRVGIPFYAYYPVDGRPVQVFPEFLTKRWVLQTIEGGH